MTDSSPLDIDETRLDYPENPIPALPTIEEIGSVIGVPPTEWHGQCHAVSLAIVRAGIIPHARVARGTCRGVRGQHSWIVGPTANGRLGDCYADNAVIIDPTLFAYRDDVEGVYALHADVDGWHVPHGKGPHIMNHGRPPKPRPDGPGPIDLSGEAMAEMDADARSWINTMFGPLDRDGWTHLAHTTVIGWPAEQIVRAMALDRRLWTLIPIDRVGMLTALNPGDLYLHTDDADPAGATFWSSIDS